MLGRRPDIVAARWRIEAATHDVSAAKKQFYPNINLNGYAGYNALKSNPLINGNSKEFGIDPAITLPIFDGSRLRAQLGSKRAELDAAIAQYNETITQAARESSDVLASTQSIVKQRVEQQDALDSAKTAYELSLERYKAGIGNYLIVLNTESQWLSQQRLYVDLQARQLDTRVALVKALGGGWHSSAAEQPKQLSAAESSQNVVTSVNKNQNKVVLPAKSVSIETQLNKEAVKSNQDTISKADAEKAQSEGAMLLGSNQ